MENKAPSSFENVWTKSIARIGSTMVLIIMALSFLPVLYLKIKYGVFPQWTVALSAWATIAAAFGTYYIIEPISYYPILGLAGTYMAFTCGSISDIRMPASAIAQEAVGVKFGSNEGQVISTIGIAGSVFVSLIAVFSAAVAGNTLISLLPDSAVTALKLYTVPSIFAAVYVQFCKSEHKLSFIILITTVIYFILAKYYGFMMITSVIIPVIITRMLYKKGVLNNNSPAKENK